MAIQSSIPHSTPIALLSLVLFSTYPLSILPFNVTHLLSPFPDLSDFTSLLSSTAVTADLADRSSITLLVVPNSHLRSAFHSSSATLADVLRYHVLLEYLSWSDLRRLPYNGRLVTTLFQTTGRATSNSGSVNITFDSGSGDVIVHSEASNATILSLIETIPYNVSIFSLSSLLVPYNLDLMASETRPTPGLNITKALIDGHNFNVAATMLTASGVVSEFEADEGGAGITLFIPTDEGFADLPSSVRFQSLPAEKKAMVLRFHVLHSYYPLGSLESIVNPVQPTLATEHNGAGSFTLNISRVNGSVGIDTGIVQASITQTVFDQNPVAIFGVSKVLLPREYFGSNPIEVNKPSDRGAVAQAPDTSLSPGGSPAVNDPPGHLSSPPGLQMRSEAGAIMVLRTVLGLWCIGFCCLLL